MNEVQNKIIAKGAFSFKIGRYLEYKHDKIMEVAPTGNGYETFYGTKQEWNQNLMKTMWNTNHIFNEWLKTEEAKMWKDKYALTNDSVIICHIPSFVYYYVLNDFYHNMYSNDKIKFTDELLTDQANDDIHIVIKVRTKDNLAQFGPKIIIKLLDFNQNSNFQLYF